MKDRCFVKRGDEWHCFMIIGSDSVIDWRAPGNEVSFAHASTEDFRRWTIHPDVLGIGTADWDARNIWAPDIVAGEDGYRMYYTGVDSSIVQRMGMAESVDLFDWRLHPSNPMYRPDTALFDYYEFEVLPSSMDGDSNFNCLLYVDHYDGRNFFNGVIDVVGGGQRIIEPALAAILPGTSANFENTPWDRMDIRAPDSGLGCFGRPLNTEYGATVQQVLGYKSLLWHTGDLDGVNLMKEDADVLIPWLTLTDGTRRTNPPQRASSPSEGVLGAHLPHPDVPSTGSQYRRRDLLQPDHQPHFGRERECGQLPPPALLRDGLLVLEAGHPLESGKPAART